MAKASSHLRCPRPQSLKELEVRAHALRDRTLGEVAEKLRFQPPPDPQRAKGYIGQVVEHALGADPKAGERPDFPDLGVELKTIPVGADGSPVESTFCCGITMATADRECWETSRLRRRLERVLWVPIQAARLAPLWQRRFGIPRLWRPSPLERAQLRDDWERLMGAIGAGRSASVSAHQGVFLQVRPKAATSRVRTLAPDERGVIQTLPLGFYLRAGFTAHILGLAQE